MSKPITVETDVTRFHTVFRMNMGDVMFTVSRPGLGAVEIATYIDFVDTESLNNIILALTGEVARRNEAYADNR